MGRRNAHRAAAAALAAALAAASIGAAPGAPATATPTAAPAATGAASAPRVERALAALADPDAAPAPAVGALPGFGEVMGYAPGTARMAADPTPRAVKRDGACSSPLGGTPFHFDLACKAHDLGYDLLRYADRTGAPLGPDARRRIDDRFALDLRNHCAVTHRGLARALCDLAGGVYAGVARLNSWRQGYGTP
jgi:hypothetical protein